MIRHTHHPAGALVGALVHVPPSSHHLVPGIVQQPPAEIPTSGWHGSRCDRCAAFTSAGNMPRLVVRTAQGDRQLHCIDVITLDPVLLAAFEDDFAILTAGPGPAVDI